MGGVREWDPDEGIFEPKGEEVTLMGGKRKSQHEKNRDFYC
jgi:hypothetical protein